MKVFSTAFTPAEVVDPATIVIDGTSHSFAISAAATPELRAVDYATQLMAFTQEGVKIGAAAADGVVYVAVVAATSVALNSNSALLRSADVAIADYTPPETAPVVSTRTTAALGGVLVGLLLAS